MQKKSLIDEKIKKFGCMLCHWHDGEPSWEQCGKNEQRFTKMDKCPNEGIKEKGVVTLCGSTRFYKNFLEVNNKLTAMGYIVLSIGVVKSKAVMLDKSDPKLESMLDELHKEKIAMSDAVLILDVDGYIGDSTKSEIKFAEWLGKKIYYYSKINIKTNNDFKKGFSRL